MIHELKCWPDYFARLADGSKTFEIRKNDRGYQAGDQLEIREYDPDRSHECADAECPGNRWTGRVRRFDVGFVAAGELFGLDLGGYAVLSLLPVGTAGQ
jgi:hypothetical protein